MSNIRKSYWAGIKILSGRLGLLFPDDEIQPATIRKFAKWMLKEALIDTVSDEALAGFSNNDIRMMWEKFDKLPKKRAKRAKRKFRVTTLVASRNGDDHFALSTLQKAKALLDDAGSPEAANAALNAMVKLHACGI